MTRGADWHYNAIVVLLSHSCLLPIRRFIVFVPWSLTILPGSKRIALAIQKRLVPEWWLRRYSVPPTNRGQNTDE